LLKLLRIELPLGYCYKYTTQGVLCILIPQFLKLWKINFEIIKPYLNKKIFSKEDQNVSRRHGTSQKFILGECMKPYKTVDVCEAMSLDLGM
jgi:hypothetical protein